MKTGGNMKARLVRTLSVFALIASVFLAALASPTDAARHPASDPDQITVQDDGANYEVGVEWITDWPGTGLDRAYWYTSANGFADELQSLGWNVRFRYGEGDAWERDLKREDLGGLNND